jgi:hypothetical protein
MDDIESIVKRCEDARTKRANFDDLFQQIGERVMPQMADFTSRMRSPGERRNELVFDSTPVIALYKYASVMESFNTPRNSQWHGLTVSDKSLAKVGRVKVWLEESSRLLFAARYSPRSNFAGQSSEVYLNLGGFGTGGLFIDDDQRSRAIRYKSINLANTWVLENHHGSIDTAFMCMRRTLRQIEQKWPGRLPPKLAQKLTVTPDETVEVLHYIAPQTDYEPGRLDSVGKPWKSCYIIPREKHELERGGYWSWPLPVARYMTGTDEIYGRSPAWMALASIKVLNEQKKTVLKAGHRATDPPLLVHEDGVLANMSPGAMNYGGLDAQGRPTIQPLMTGQRIDIGKDLMDDERKIIAEGFLIDLFRAFIENPTMTATQTMELVKERAHLLAPIGGRLQSEWFGPQIERELDILQRANQLPEMPPEMIEAQGEYEIEYTSPMAKAMRATEAVAIARSLEAILPLAQVDPSVLDGIKLDEIPGELWDINGAPAKLLRTPEEIEAMREGRQQQAQTEQLVQAAPAVSAAAANLTKMQQAFGGVPA